MKDLKTKPVGWGDGITSVVGGGYNIGYGDG